VSGDDHKHDWANDLGTEAGPIEEDFSGTSVLLIVRRKDGTEVVSLPPGGATIGRSRDSTIAIDDPRVSRNHARIALEGTALVVEDFGSRNGTMIDGAVVSGGKRPVVSGAVIRVGGASIVVARSTRVDAPVEASELEGRHAPPEIVGDIAIADQKMTHVFDLVRKVARTPATVLILGETGTGKEVVAEQIHAQSSRAAKPFVRVNCGAIPEALFESEFFGHEKGAFTGADRRKVGYVEAASGGTLLIDEIGELSVAAQVKLLRVLETHTISRVGGTTEIPVDIRVVCATHRNLQDLVAANRFRADLYYRISSFVIRIPPLRERTSEIPLLISVFAKRFAAQMGEEAPLFEQEVLSAMSAYAWPGNVRELRNVVEHALVMSEGKTVALRHLPGHIVQGGSTSTPEGVRSEIAELERTRIQEALAKTHGNRTKAAELLGISRRALVYKLARYKLRP
jgi:transcriptional regulator with PAS, ATPase and Fis domain